MPDRMVTVPRPLEAGGAVSERHDAPMGVHEHAGRATWAELARAALAPHAPVAAVRPAHGVRDGVPVSAGRLARVAVEVG